jgi:hypothetical protein
MTVHTCCIILFFVLAGLFKYKIEFKNSFENGFDFGKLEKKKKVFLSSLVLACWPSQTACLLSWPRPLPPPLLLAHSEPQEPSSFSLASFWPAHSWAEPNKPARGRGFLSSPLCR